MIYFLTEKPTRIQISDMLQEYGSMIKIAVDVRLGTLAGGGEMHADCEQVLLQHGSEQDDIWGANWYPEEQSIAFEALINIRPRQNNRGLVIQSEDIRRKVEKITREIFGGIK